MEKKVRIRLHELLKFLTHIKNVYPKLAVLPYILVSLAMNALFQLDNVLSYFHRQSQKRVKTFFQMRNNQFIQN